MATLIRVVAGGLLVAHGLVHLLYVVDDVPEFTLERSWLLPDPARRTVGLALMAATIAGFALVGLAVWGVPGLAGLWPTLTLMASVTSLVLLLTFWNGRLVFGVALAIALIAIAVIRPEWTTRVG